MVVVPKQRTHKDEKKWPLKRFCMKERGYSNVKRYLVFVLLGDPSNMRCRQASYTYLESRLDLDSTVETLGSPLVEEFIQEQDTTS